MTRARYRLILVALLLGAAVCSAQSDPAAAARARNVELRELLRKLQTTGRLMQTVAHPDDEDGAMLTLEARGHGASVLLLTLTRGEGGQNKMGSNLLDSLGVLRTLELLASDNYYGVEQRFTRVADFGFSKTADETFQKWRGHDAALADMVRVIRTFRPDVLVSRFSGTPRDGHGHHQAAGILTREAFRAAGDPGRFPEQIREGLSPWQPKKLYSGNLRPFGSTAPLADAAYTVALDTGGTDQLLGTSYAQYAMQGLKHQLSQGAGSWEVRPGPHISYYKLDDSALPKPAPGTHEEDFFDGIDTTLPALASRLGQDETRVPWLRPDLERIARYVGEASAAADHDGDVATPLLKALAVVRELGYFEQVAHRMLSPRQVDELYANIQTKRDQLRRACALAVGLEIEATVDAPVAPDPQDIFVAVPGQAFTVKIKATNHGTKTIASARYILWGNDRAKGKNLALLARGLAPAASASAAVTVRESPMQPLTKPYWHRNDPEADTTYTIDDPRYATLPFVPRPLWVYLEYSANGYTGQLEVPVEVAYREGSEAHRTPLSVAPAISVAVTPLSRIVREGSTTAIDATVTLQKNIAGSVHAAVRLQLPAGWRSEPAGASVNVAEHHASVQFRVRPERSHPGRDAIKALVECNGKTYTDGYTVVTRPDLGAAFYYQSADERVSVVDVNVPERPKIGYIMGAGDDIPAVLRQIGVSVTELSEEDISTGDLRRFDTIVLGIRAYDTREEVRNDNARLLEYAQNGGTLVVQYNSGVADFNAGHFTPYPAELSRDRVSVEEARIEILSPDNPVFHYPNLITAADFNGWVQERGLYFMDKWDSQFTPLLDSHDPGEPERKGGMLYAKYGKGIYIYTGYSFFRQLPAGVPGAIRLFVNLISAGHQ